MYYEINVSLNGNHFFATDSRSITTQWELLKIYPVLAAKFPESEGYKLTVSRWESRGTGIDVEALLAEKKPNPNLNQLHHGNSLLVKYDHRTNNRRKSY